MLAALCLVWEILGDFALSGFAGFATHNVRKNPISQQGMNYYVCTKYRSEVVELNVELRNKRHHIKIFSNQVI